MSQEIKNNIYTVHHGAASNALKCLLRTFQRALFNSDLKVTETCNGSRGSVINVMRSGTCACHFQVSIEDTPTCNGLRHFSALDGVS